MVEKEKASNMLSLYFVRASSDMDLARYNCTFSSSMSAIFSHKEGSKTRLFVPSDKIGKTTIALYYMGDAASRYAIYHPGSNSTPEKLEFVDKFEENQGYNSYRMPIVGFKSWPIKEKELKNKDVACVIFNSPEAIAISLISKGSDIGIMEKVYSFLYKGKRYIGSFDLITEESPTFVCAEVNFDKGYGFLKYNYTNDMLEPSDLIGDNTASYLREINLAEPFSFFKPE
ncbi:hypothetical protein M1439_03395 [Candidatus Marsarchaeota archaeon]|jgi:hypothetical protein|nr:hypothetical protein [Candidatus Marsarchaeota archaeon]